MEPDLMGEFLDGLYDLLSRYDAVIKLDYDRNTNEDYLLINIDAANGRNSIKISGDKPITFTNIPR